MNNKSWVYIFSKPYVIDVKSLSAYLLIIFKNMNDNRIYKDKFVFYKFYKLLLNSNKSIKIRRVEIKEKNDTTKLKILNMIENELNKLTHYKKCYYKIPQIIVNVLNLIIDNIIFNIDKLNESQLNEKLIKISERMEYEMIKKLRDSYINFKMFDQIKFVNNINIFDKTYYESFVGNIDNKC